jgi:UV DNA damage endonuclease
MLRFGICCKFARVPIRFRTTTATAMLRIGRRQALQRLSDLALANADALQAALTYCAQHGVGAFRISSDILPVRTHPRAGYRMADLPESREIVRRFRACGRFARERGLRTLFHPDQFVVLNSPDKGIVRRAVADLEHHAEMAEWVGADVINVHGGGAYGDKDGALRRLEVTLGGLPAGVRQRLTLENDERTFAPADLLPVCRRTGIPMVYDVHHHRCLPDGGSESQATHDALGTWNREPVLHLSSPRDGWKGRAPHRHHDYIALSDFPSAWRRLDATVEIEAKAKELAVLRLMRDLRGAAGRQAASGTPRPSSRRRT